MRKLFPLILLSLAIFSCGRDAENISNREVLQSQYEAMAILDQLDQLVEQHNKAGHTVQDALIRSMNDIGQHPEVRETHQVDSMYIYITMTSGIKVRFTLMPVDPAGNALFRGAGDGGGGTFKQLSSTLSESCTEITNKTVLVYHPYNDIVSAAQIGWAENLENYKKEGVIDDYNIVLHEACTYDVVKSFPNYGLVIISTHGFPDGFSFTKMWDTPDLGDELKSADEIISMLQSTQDKQVTDQIKLGLVYIEMTKKYEPSAGMQQNWEGGFSRNWGLATSSPLIAQWDLSNTIVAGLFCYSGYESNLGLQPDVVPVAEAFRAAGTRTYYGFQHLSGQSQPVDDLAARNAEVLLYTNFLSDLDSSGIAHLNANGEEIYDEATHRAWPHKPKNHFRLVSGSEEYCFKSCGENFTDLRDGQEYATVCIGEQVWMAENLRYLPAVHSNAEFSDAADNSQPAYGVYDYNGNNISVAKAHPNFKTHGVLYNYWAILQGRSPSNTNPSGVQGICPEGWHVPSKAEFEQLTHHLGGSTVAGGKLKEDGFAHWASPNTDATNQSGFTAIPSGSRNGYAGGVFSDLNQVGFLWTATDTVTPNGTSGNVVLLKYNDATANVGSAGKGIGYSCRCIKD